jgi:Ricin-type beta-trefoil lectin domain
MLGRMSVNRFLRLKLELVPVVIVAAGSLLGSAGGSGTVAAALSAQPRPSHLEIVKVPVSSVPASVRARLPRGRGNDPAQTYEIVNYADDSQYCLDASTSGSLAGKNGDKVQLATCESTGSPDQWWYQGTTNGAGYSTLVNDLYKSQCLNADDKPLHDGSVVQLWNCDVGTSNEFWNVDSLLDQPSFTSLTLEDGSVGGDPTYILDAMSQHIGNGDQVQIWTPNGLPNQGWCAWQVVGGNPADCNAS